MLNRASATRSGLCLPLLLVLVAGCGNRGDLYLEPDDVDVQLEDDVRRIGEDTDVPAPDDDPDDVERKKAGGTRGTSEPVGESVDAITNQVADEAGAE